MAFTADDVQKLIPNCPHEIAFTVRGSHDNVRRTGCAADRWDCCVPVYDAGMLVGFAKNLRHECNQRAITPEIAADRGVPLGAWLGAEVKIHCVGGEAKVPHGYESVTMVGGLLTVLPSMVKPPNRPAKKATKARKKAKR